MTKKNSETKGFLGWIERVGNKLPHPVIIFIYLALIIILVSEIAFRMGASATYFDAKSNKEVTVKAISLLNGSGLAHIFNMAPKNFTSFPPLGTVLVTLLGVGVAEWTGLIGTALKKLISKVPPSALTVVVVFAGIISNIASDAGYVVVIPLGAIVFASAKRHPIAGLAAAFAGVSGGFSANIMFGPTDALLSGITNAALKAAGISYEVSITGNWYFIVASTVLLTIIGTFVTEKVVEPLLGAYEGDVDHEDEKITSDEERGLKNAGIALLVVFGILLLLTIPQNAPFRALNEKTGKMTIEAFLSNGLIFYIFFLFAVPGIVFGKAVGKIKDSSDFVEGMSEAMRNMGGFIVLAFFAAQVIEYFSYTNLGLILANSGANFLKAINFTGVPLIIAFILLTAFINLFIGSASAKWGILAPIFVPIFYKLGFTPELTQMAYRVADSSTNIISPLMSYFAMILIFMKKYDKKSGIGTLISVMLPYSMYFLISWTILLIIWFITKLPLGPGAGVLL